ncbi:MAG: transporter [Gammaproteobacteria bacterium]|nr:transporter [Gammaproteobacteria bacterium]
MKTCVTRYSPLLSGLMAFLVLVCGCSLAPHYRKPDLDPVNQFKEESITTAPQGASMPPEYGEWKPAQPSEQAARGEWWTIFEDATLNDLEARALDGNPSLKAAVARVKEARAMRESTRASLFPTVDAGFGPTREKLSAASQLKPDGVDIPTQTVWRAQAGVAYEADLFGRVSDSVKAATAETEQMEALFRSTRLALQADVAQNYFNLRELDAELEVYTRSVTLREQALELVQRRFEEGQISELDVARASAELSTARSDAMTAQRLRAASEHSLAVLLGKAVAEFTLAANPLRAVGIHIPAGMPSSMLERRPDIAAAERSMAAANARIGVAKAAYFPSLSLTGTGGVESAALSDLFHWSSRAFLAGPLVGTALTVPLFDGGRRKGNLANARAVYEESVANYRQQVLVAFREVEDSLSDLRILEGQTPTQADAVKASTRAAQISRSQYTEGAVNFLDVIDADRTVLQAQRVAAQLAGTQAVSTVNLIRALGGGWGDAPALAASQEPTSSVARR